MEGQPTGPELHYASPRDQALHALWDEGWCNETSGSDGTVTGPFARVSNTEDDLRELTREFGEQWQALGIEAQAVVGHFLLGHDSTDQEGVVVEFDTSNQLIEAFNTLKRVYEAQRDGLI